MKKALFIIITLLISGTSYSSENYDQYLSLLGYKLEETNLYEIKDKLGDTPISHSGDAANSYYGICYYLKSDNVSLYFESGEMGGDKHDLLSFVVKKSTATPKNCKELKGVKLRDLNLGPLQIGKPINEVVSQLPQPLKKSKSKYAHEHSGQRPFTKEEMASSGVTDPKEAFFDVYIYIDVYVSNNRISGYKVGEIISY